MKILYDHQAFSNEKFGGVSKYYCELMKNIPSEHKFNLSLILSDNQYLKEEYDFFRKMIIPWSDREFSGKSFLKRKIDFINRQYLSLIHISEPTRRTPISYAVFCLKNK